MATTNTDPDLLGLFAKSFGERDYLSDCILQLVQEPQLRRESHLHNEDADDFAAQESDEEGSTALQEGPSKRARRGSFCDAAGAAAAAGLTPALEVAASTVAAVPVVMHSQPAHRAVLSQAAYFRGRIQFYEGTIREVKQSRDPEKLLECLCPALKLALEGPNEVEPALEAVEFLYTGKVKSTTATDLLCVRRQGAYIGSSRCEEACDAALAKTEISFEDACGVFGFIGSGQHATPLGQNLKDHCVRLLVGRLGSAHECMQDEARRALLLQLPANALQALLASDQLEAEIEDDVLAMLLAWTRKHKPQKALCKLLLQSMRLSCLSKTYLDSVLPTLSATSTVQLAEVRLYARVRGGPRASYVRQALSIKRYAAWVKDPRACASAAAVAAAGGRMAWRLPLPALEQLLQVSSQQQSPAPTKAVHAHTSGPLGFYRGHWFGLGLRCTWLAGATSPKLELFIQAFNEQVEGSVTYPLMVHVVVELEGDDGSVEVGSVPKNCLVFVNGRNSNTGLKLPQPSGDVQGDMLQWRVKHGCSDGCVGFRLNVMNSE